MGDCFCEIPLENIPADSKITIDYVKYNFKGKMVFELIEYRDREICLLKRYIEQLEEIIDKAGIEIDSLKYQLLNGLEYPDHIQGEIGDLAEYFQENNDTGQEYPDSVSDNIPPMKKEEYIKGSKELLDKENFAK